MNSKKTIALRTARPEGLIDDIMHAMRACRAQLWIRRSSHSPADAMAMDMCCWAEARTANETFLAFPDWVIAQKMRANDDANRNHRPTETTADQHRSPA